MIYFSFEGLYGRIDEVEGSKITSECSIPENCVRVTASGSELKCIQRNFDNLTMPLCEKVHFFGETAKMIAAHWRIISKDLPSEQKNL